MATYSYKKDGNKNLSEHFKVKEFQCKDGSDIIEIDSNLVALLQKIRTHFGKPVNISSAYRTKAYNTKIGGATKSQHLYGTAADFRIAGIEPRDIARYVESNLSPGGLGLYDYAKNDKDGFVHIDTRAGKSRWYRTKSSGEKDIVVKNIVTDYLDKGKTYPTLRLGSKGEDVKALQVALGINADGIFGVNTESAVKAYQKSKGLVADGIVGAKTYVALGWK